MYRIIQNGEVVSRFNSFSEAWVYARLCNRFCIISHPVDGYWIIDPAVSN